MYGNANPRAFSSPPSRCFLLPQFQHHTSPKFSNPYLAAHLSVHKRMPSPEVNGAKALFEGTLGIPGTTSRKTFCCSGHAPLPGKKENNSPSAQRRPVATEYSSIDCRDFFNGPIPSKLFKLLGYLTLSRIGVYIPLGGVDREAFVQNFGQSTFFNTLDSLCGGGIGKLGICSLGIIPFINAQILIQLLIQIYPELRQYQKVEGEAGRKKVLQYTRYASVAFAIIQAIGHIFYLKPYINDFSMEWFLSSVTLLSVGSMIIAYIAEAISELKIGSGISLLIFTSIASQLPTYVGMTFMEAFRDGNYGRLVAIISFFVSLAFGIVYFQEAERRIPLNYASRCIRTERLKKCAYLPFKVNSSGVMPIVLSASFLSFPGMLARYTGLHLLKMAEIALDPTGFFWLPASIVSVFFFNYHYTILQLDPDDVSEQLKYQGAAVPLVRPGKNTASYLRTVLGRISVVGSAFLVVFTVGPVLIEQFTHLTAFSGSAAATLLILAGCATDTARKLQAEIISHSYTNIQF